MLNINLEEFYWKTDLSHLTWKITFLSNVERWKSHVTWRKSFASPTKMFVNTDPEIRSGTVKEKLFLYILEYTYYLKQFQKCLIYVIRLKYVIYVKLHMWFKTTENKLISQFLYLIVYLKIISRFTACSNYPRWSLHFRHISQSSWNSCSSIWIPVPKHCNRSLNQWQRISNSHLRRLCTATHVQHSMNQKREFLV